MILNNEERMSNGDITKDDETGMQSKAYFLNCLDDFLVLRGEKGLLAICAPDVSDEETESIAKAIARHGFDYTTHYVSQCGDIFAGAIISNKASLDVKAEELGRSLSQSLGKKYGMAIVHISDAKEKAQEVLSKLEAHAYTAIGQPIQQPAP
jgi:hypothetical protein